MKFRKADKRDIDNLLSLYDDVIEQQKYDEYGASWTRGVYPTDEDIRLHLENGEIYIGESEGTIACSCAVVAGEEEMYKGAGWNLKVAPEEVAVVHLLAVNKCFRGKGYAMSFLEFLRKELIGHFKVIHLDALVSNLPADRLYRKFGFRCIGRYPVWYEDLGNTEVSLYEYAL
ncbi:MAG: GNAT family N-acetyltransferase [Erysipelotrichaceae bacterium]|nr:GNAT family N-acetyltransferase [Erysipelotrichaceae bacterium]